MAIYTNKGGLGTWLSPALGALVLIAGLVIVLLWQCIEVLRSQREAEQAILHNFAEIAADEWVRRSNAQIGYRGYYQALNALQELGRTDPQQVCQAPQYWNQSGDPSRRELAALLAGVVFLDAGVDQCGTEGAGIVDHINSQRAGSKGAPDPLSAYHQFNANDSEQRWGTWIFGPVDDRRWVAFKVNADGLAARFAELFQGPSLLPRSVRDADTDLARLNLRVTDPAGRIVYASDPASENYRPAHSVNFGSDYGAILDGYAVRVEIPAALGRALVEQSPPIIHLGLIFGLGGMTLLLGAIAWLQLRREQDLVALRGDFVARVSHELRTPLTQISLYADTLVLGRSSDPAARKQALLVIQREARRLTHLIGNILRFSAPTRGRSTAQPLSLADATREAVEAARMLAPGRQISLLLGAEALVAVDRDGLHLALMNLIDNAVKYSPPTSMVRVEQCCEQGRAAVHIDDAGLGIPAEHRTQVREAYFRLARDRDSATPGTGIGLSVVEGVARRYGGSLLLDQSELGGTRATLTFAAVPPT